MAKANPKAFFPGVVATISYKKVDAYAQRQASFKPFFDTWEEAHQFMLDRAMKKLELASRELERHRKRLASVLAMKPPAGKGGA